MNEFGHFALCLAWGLSLYGLFAGLYAGKSRDSRWTASVVHSTLLVGVCATVSLAALGALFLASDFSNQYVWQFSNRSMESIYKFTAIWGGMDGSMLLWAAVLTLCGARVAMKSKHYPRELVPWVLAVVNSSSLFFLTVVTYLTNPFRYIKGGMLLPEGNGLNPLLQNPYMAIHPPMLYLGFTTLSIPFAFCIGALLSKQITSEWIRLTRHWTLLSWAFLTAGITLGGYWAYIELGWGGFWAWDPVENASFLPWLTATAFLHSVMVQERKDMLKFWNVWLVVLTYGLTVFGTFLTRSGVVQSVHAFASTNVGWVFLLYLGIIFVVTAVLTYVRRNELRSQRRIESLLSREAAFLMNNLLFLSITFATLWGVMFPVLSEALTGTKQAVGIPYFNAVNVPLFLLLILLMGIGPLIAWKRATLKQLRKTFLMPFVAALIAGVALIWAGVSDFYALLSYSLSFFVLLTILGEFHRGMHSQRATAGSKGVVKDFGGLVRRHRTRYGGYFIHMGVLIASIGITASMAHKFEKEFNLSVGSSIDFGRYRLTLVDLEEVSTKNYTALVANASLSTIDGKELTVLRPELRRYRRNDESTTEVALHKSLRDDFYLVLAGLSSDKAAFKVFINPLQAWLWIGVAVMVVGTLLVLSPQRAIARVEHAVRNREEALDAP